MLTEVADAILRKLARKTKIGVYNPVEVVEALKLLDKDWSIDTAVAPVNLHTYGDVGSLGVALLRKRVGGDARKFYISKGFTIKDPYSIQSEADEKGDRQKLTEEHAKRLADAVKADLSMYAGKTPPKVEEWGLYAKKVEVDRGHYDDSFHVKVYGLTLGVPAWRVTGPDGKALLLPILPKLARDVEESGKMEPRTGKEMSSPTLWTWLFKTYPGVPKAAADVALDPEAEAARAKRQIERKVGDEAGTYGHCPVCGNLQKLHNRRPMEGHPTMVLHGYQRPGYGYIIGDCFGVNYPPYELSAIGCVKYAEHLDGLIKNQRKTVANLKAATHVRAFVSRGEDRWSNPDGEATLTTIHKDGSIEFKEKDRAKIRELRKSLFPVKIHYVPEMPSEGEAMVFKALFKTINAEEIKDAEQQLSFMISDRKFMQQKIDGWKAQPLPGTVRARAETKAGVDQAAKALAATKKFVRFR